MTDYPPIDWKREPGAPGTIAEEFAEGTYYWDKYGGRVWVEKHRRTPEQQRAMAQLHREIKESLRKRANDPPEPPPPPPPLADQALVHGRLRADGWTPDRQRAFLTHLAESGCVTHACAHVGLSKQSAYALRRRAPRSVFAQLWDVAIHHARQALLDEVTERALLGTEVPVWYHGEQVGTRRVFNDRLAMFILGRKVEPLHPTLTPGELHQLWPDLMENVDVILPPPLSPDRIAELGGDAPGPGG